MEDKDNPMLESVEAEEDRERFDRRDRDDLSGRVRVRVTFTGEFVTQRKTSVGDDVVCRTSFRVADGLVDVVLPPAAHGDSFDLLTGAQYTVDGWVARPPSADASGTGDVGGVDRADGRPIDDPDDVLVDAAGSLGVDGWFVVGEEIRQGDRGITSDEGEADEQSTEPPFDSLEEFLAYAETAVVDR